MYVSNNRLKQDLIALLQLNMGRIFFVRLEKDCSSTGNNFHQQIIPRDKIAVYA